MARHGRKTLVRQYQEQHAVALDAYVRSRSFWNVVGTAYWANLVGRSSAVHLHYAGRPLCGYQPAARLEMQIIAAGMALNYVTCTSCRKVYARHETEIKAQHRTVVDAVKTLPRPKRKRS